MMKTMMKMTLVTLSLVIGTWGTAFATTVNVSSFSTGSEYALGYYSVGITPAPGHAGSSMSVSYHSGGSININAYDAPDNLRFFCYVTSSSNLYQHAKEIVSGLSEMTLLFAVKNPSVGNECTTIQTINSTYNFPK